MTFFPLLQSTALSRFLSPLIELRHSLPEGATIDDLIIANVKKTVQTVCESEVGIIDGICKHIR